MKQYLFLLPALALSAQVSWAASIKSGASCGAGEFVISGEYDGEGPCTVDETLMVNGVETNEQYTFSGSVTRTIPLAEGDVASVQARFTCVTPNGAAGGGAFARTSNGCAGSAPVPTLPPTPSPEPTVTPQPTATPLPTPTSTPEPEGSALQSSLDSLLTYVEDRFERIEARVARIEARRPELAEQYRQSSLERMARSVSRQLDGITRRYQDEVAAHDLDAAVMAFKESYALITESSLN